ncbi:unnamed protein product [Oikopleura dioica]|uniref:Zinc finger PHD-type domain-containing protein n=1 Tax=Oikopleura dioica TaxID=34765 RepID=E4XH19_OIKDI|nr:unnamed protein product [Oikopleura dioica]
MDDERTHCICGFTHHTRLMICCDECNVWLHAECYGLDQKRVKEIEKKNLEFFCNVCHPRTDLDVERAQALQRREAARQEEKKEKRRRRAASESSESSEDDDSPEGSERRFSREDRKAMEYEKLFDKLKKDETKRRRKERPETDNKVGSDVEDEENDVSDDEDETLKAGRGRGRRGRPPKSAAKAKEKELATRRSTKEIESLPTTRKKPGRRPGRRPARNIKPVEVEPVVLPEPSLEMDEAETESADSGLEDEEPVIMPRFVEIPVRSRKRKPLDFARFSNVGEFGKSTSILQSDNILAWRNGNNSRAVVKPE